MTRRPTLRRQLRHGLRALGIAGGILVFSLAAQADPLRDRLQALAAERGFDLEGLERIGTEDARPVDRRDPADRIGRLLADYNFVIARDAQGRIARLTIVGSRAAPVLSAAPRPAPADAGSTEHYVEAQLTGPNGRLLALRVMVDTGASTLVLPRSMADRLGFAAQDGTEVRVQTANGMTGGVLATLDSVRVDGAEAQDVAVTFVEDSLLGGKQLLGMSFLSRFRLTIDGRTGRLDLEERGE